MKVTLLNHSDRLGGASIATFRLLQALNASGIETRMLVMHKSTDDICVAEASTKGSYKRTFLVERLKIFLNNGFSKKNLFKVSIANTGKSLTNHPWITDADIIVLNWINQGMLSLSQIREIGKLGKPIVWTMHDMWCLTGACHHAMECERYKLDCSNCKFFHTINLAHKTWARKKELYESTQIHFVAVSNWLATKCRESSLLKGCDISVIHNAFPIDFYAPAIDSDNHMLPFGIDRTKNIILMGAARLDDPIKGIDYAIDAFNFIYDKYPDIADICLVVLFGNIRDASILKQIRMPYIYLGQINDPKTLRELYACSKVVVSTSLYETFGLTLIEGQAAGCVPVTFGMGGQEDIIKHKETGYIAEYKSAQSIADGILWALENPPSRQMLHDSVKEKFASTVIAEQYIDLFNKLLTA